MTLKYAISYALSYFLSDHECSAPGRKYCAVLAKSSSRVMPALRRRRALTLRISASFLLAAAGSARAAAPSALACTSLGGPPVVSTSGNGTLSVLQNDIQGQDGSCVFALSGTPAAPAALWDIAVRG